MAKLEMERQNVPQKYAAAYATLFSSLSGSCMRAIDDVNSKIVNDWEAFKTKTRKHIVPFARRRAPLSTSYLSLPNSRPKLNRILEDFSTSSSRAQVPKPMRLNVPCVAINENRFQGMITTYTSLYDFELDLLEAFQNPPTSKEACELRCQQASKQIRDLVLKIENSYEGLVDCLSSAILLVLELWVFMDTMALTAFPLLRAFHPGLPPDLCNGLQLRSYDEML